MAARVSYSSLCLFHLCAPGLLHGVQHKADVHKSPLNTVSLRDAQQLKNVFNGHKVAGSAGDYQADERAGVARLSWRVSG